MVSLLERQPAQPKEIIDRHSMIITMDGSTTAGKRVISEKLANRYNLTIFNTGTTVRALALLAIESKMVKTDGSNVTTIPVDFADRIVDFYDQLPEKLRIDKPKEGSHTARVMVGDRDMLGELITYPKQKAIENLSAVIASSPAMRWKLYQFWRDSAGQLGGVIVIGRKTGLDLFPDAKVKLYLFASPDASATYRVAHDPTAHKDVISEQRYIRERDGMDKENGLLDRPSGALVLDTSHYIKDLAGLSDLEGRIASYVDSRYTIR